MSSDGDIDANQIFTSVGTGMALAASVLGAVNLIGIPVSYVLNRFVYHGTKMRILLALVTVILSIPLLIGMLIYQGITWGSGIQKVHYFGYLPLIYKGGDKPAERPDTGPMGWILPLVTPVWNFIRDTLLGGFVEHHDTPADVAAFNQAGAAILLPPELKGSALAISEEAVELALEAAKALTRDQAETLEQQQMAVRAAQRKVQ